MARGCTESGQLAESMFMVVLVWIPAPLFGERVDLRGAFTSLSAEGAG
jgi:hypothetical protein